MEYNTVTFGSSNQYSITKPSGSLLYAYNPYFMQISNVGINNLVKLSSGSVLFERYSDVNGNVKFPLSELLTKNFLNKDFGDIDSPVSNYENTQSKLIETEVIITATVGVDHIDIEYDVSYGALQQTEQEKTIEMLFAFKNSATGLCYPVTITEKFGDGKGKDLWVSNKIDDEDAANDIIVGSKTYKIELKSVCPDSGNYLRWVYNGEYRYFFFENGIEVDELKDGNFVNKIVWDDFHFSNTYRSDSRLKDKSGSNTIECGVKSATYEQQMHLLGLQRSIMQWLYIGDNIWQEVNIKMTPFQIDRFKARKEINLTIIKPSLYIESL